MLGFFGIVMIFVNLGLMLVDCNVLQLLNDNSPILEYLPMSHLAFSAFVFSTGSLFLTMLWNCLDFNIPGISAFVSLEHLRHNVQRHHLFFADGANHSNDEDIKDWENRFSGRETLLG